MTDYVFGFAKTDVKKGDLVTIEDFSQTKQKEEVMKVGDWVNVIDDSYSMMSILGAKAEHMEEPRGYLQNRNPWRIKGG